MATPLEWSEWQDAIVRKIYSTPSFAQRRKAIKEHLPRLAPRNKYQVYNRGIALGIVKPLKKTPPWTEAEIELVEKWGHCTDATIAKKLKAAGYARTVNAVHVYRNRHVAGFRQGKIDAGIYSACQVADLVGASSRTVTHWIEKGWLKAKRGANHGPNVTWEIKASDLRTFLIHHITYCDLSRADKFMLVDILCPHGAKGAGREAA